MKLSKCLAIACVVLALANCINLNAMEHDLDKQLWQAMYADNQEAIKRLLAAGANVNAEDRSGHTLLYRYLFSEFGNKEKRADIIITLLAAGANLNHPLITSVRAPTEEWIYGDVPQVAIIMKNVKVTPEEIASVRPAILKQLESITTVEKLFFIPEVQDLIRRKLTAIRIAVPSTDWSQYDKTKLQYAIELQILNAIPEAKVKFPGTTFVTYNLSVPEPTAPTQPVTPTPQPEPVPAQKDNLQPSLEYLAQTLHALAQQLSVQPNIQPQPSPQPVAPTSSEKITNEKLWAKIYKNNPSWQPLPEEQFLRGSQVWSTIARRNAITRDKVEDAIIEYLLYYRKYNNKNIIFDQYHLDQFEAYIQDPSRLNEFM